MDLNEAIPALIKALNDHTKAVNALVAMGGKAAAPTTAAASGTKPAGDKPKADAKKDDKPKKVTDDVMRSTVGDYIAAATDDDDREVRRSNVKALLAHYEAKGATSIPEAKRHEALAYVKQFADGERPDFMPEEEASEEEADDLLG